MQVLHTLHVTNEKKFAFNVFELPLQRMYLSYACLNGEDGLTSVNIKLAAVLE